MNTESFRYIRGLLPVMLLAFLLSGCTTNPVAGDRQWQQWPALGIRLRVIAWSELPPAMQRTHNDGLLVVTVTPDKPADRAGVRPGDYLAAMDGRAVTGMGDAVGIMQAKRTGDQVRLTLLRDGETLDVSADLSSGGKP